MLKEAGQQQQAAPPVINLRNINAFDPAVVGDYLGSSACGFRGKPTTDSAAKWSTCSGVNWTSHSAAIWTTDSDPNWATF